jgi:hypothetical protein
VGGNCGGCLMAGCWCGAGCKHCSGHRIAQLGRGLVCAKPLGDRWVLIVGGWVKSCRVQCGGLVLGEEAGRAGVGAMLCIKGFTCCAAAPHTSPATGQGPGSLAAPVPAAASGAPAAPAAAAPGGTAAAAAGTAAPGCRCHRAPRVAASGQAAAAAAGSAPRSSFTGGGSSAACAAPARPLGVCQQAPAGGGAKQRFQAAKGCQPSR